MQNNEAIIAAGLLWPVLYSKITLSVNQFATSLTVTEIQMPHGITQCYLQPGIPTFTQPIKASTRRDARLSWDSWLDYTLRWYTSPKTVTHPSINRSQNRVTSLMWRTTLLLCQTANISITSCWLLATKHHSSALYYMVKVTWLCINQSVEQLTQ